MVGILQVPELAVAEQGTEAMLQEGHKSHPLAMDRDPFLPKDRLNAALFRNPTIQDRVVYSHTSHRRSVRLHVDLYGCFPGPRLRHLLILLRTVGASFPRDSSPLLRFEDCFSGRQQPQRQCCFDTESWISLATPKVAPLTWIEVAECPSVFLHSRANNLRHQ